MRIIIYGKNIEVTEGLKGMLEKKLNKFDKYFKSDVEATATLSTQKNKHILEVQIQFNGNLLRAEEATDDMYASIDKVVDKLEGQLRKYKSKIEKRQKDSTIRFESFDKEKNGSSETKIVKTKKFAIKPMSSEEATLQMDLIGHTFFVFLNSESDEVNVVYKRKDGNFGLIEPMF
ncbi:ribosome-associated translation inhibitor RaiA [Alkalibaculum sp. M08DMB]|uniref:Ribosome hibernation promoting factor n=1 Tax=Alkalibaculum sporogenes TaxID=2655001 RepID=A0A6A7K663_9FIRM|nr:ribosome-associated translation inhibitor RaiA [Alkalibaculum sporogenes]MPW24854.1 ribosome-associated translation inhibitor RaiA [Alkalibaculum sporogenes]